MSEKKRTKITIDTSKAGSNIEVLRLCLDELEWQECAHGSKCGGCDIYWHSQAYYEGYANGLFIGNRVGCVNKFPCMNQLLRKGPLVQSLNVMRLIYGEHYDFYPRTWFLPEQFEDFRLHCSFVNDQLNYSNEKLKVFIVKPNIGSQGDGIYLIKDAQAYLDMKLSGKIASNESYIVQEYIDNPYLMDNLKSDLRIYVLVSNLRPLEIHMYDEGLVRFATVNYQYPDYQNLDQVFMHLTNYAINKQNVDSYKFTSDDLSDDESNRGHKRKLTKVFAELQSKGIDVDKIKREIDDLVIKTLFALISEMKVEYSFEIPFRNRNDGTACFQIFGFDILLTDQLKPMLLEVNCNPSLRIDFLQQSIHSRAKFIPSPIDRDVKKPLVYETLMMMAPKKKLELM